jgi:uncharacterized protein YndB with AHSA1/START domain
MGSAKELKVTRLSDVEVQLTREFDAPRDLVFKTMMDPKLIPQWWGPRRYTTGVDKMDVRVGGKWRFWNRGADGQEFWFNGEYREIVPPQKVVQTFEFEPMAGHISVDTLTLDEIAPGRTRMTVRSKFANKEDCDGMLQSGMESGASETYERLDEILAERQRAAAAR